MSLCSIYFPLHFNIKHVIFPISKSFDLLMSHSLWPTEGRLFLSYSCPQIITQGLIFITNTHPISQVVTPQILHFKLSHLPIYALPCGDTIISMVWPYPASSPSRLWLLWFHPSSSQQSPSLALLPNFILFRYWPVRFLLNQSHKRSSQVTKGLFHSTHAHIKMDT